MPSGETITRVFLDVSQQRVVKYGPRKKGIIIGKAISPEWYRVHGNNVDVRAGISDDLSQFSGCETRRRRYIRNKPLLSGERISPNDPAIGDLAGTSQPALPRPHIGLV
jgi:hypothetical protein